MYHHAPVSALIVDVPFVAAVVTVKYVPSVKPSTSAALIVPVMVVSSSPVPVISPLIVVCPSILQITI